MLGLNLNRSGFGKSNYGASTEIFDFNSSRRFAHVVDGTSNTIFLGEATTYNAVAKDSTLGTGDGRCGGLTCDFQGKLWMGIRTDWGDTLVFIYSSTVGFYGINGTNSTSWNPQGHIVSSVHVGGAHVLFGDGRVRFLSENINALTYQALGSRDKGDEIGEY